MLPEAADDPVKRYRQLLELTRSQPRPELSQQALEEVISNSGERDAVPALSEHVAKYSRLSEPEARTLVGAAMGETQGSQAKAAALSAAIATLPSGELQLSDPVTLKPWARVIFSLILSCAAGGCIWQIATLGEAKGSQESAIIALAIVGVFALIGVLVLAMGYKNVTIKGGG